MKEVCKRQIQNIGYALDMNTDALIAFVDEIGDRGYIQKPSEYFAMVAVGFSTLLQQKVKHCIANIRSEYGIPAKTVFHWQKHKDFVAIINLIASYYFLECI